MTELAKQRFAFFIFFFLSMTISPEKPLEWLANFLLAESQKGAAPAAKEEGDAEKADEAE
jgi:hypothetical protein